MVASLLETILITNLHSGSSRFAPVPRWVRVVFLQTLGCCVGLPSKPPKEHPKGKGCVRLDFTVPCSKTKQLSTKLGREAEEDEEVSIFIQGEHDGLVLYLSRQILPFSIKSNHGTQCIRCTHFNRKDLYYHTDPNAAVEEGAIYMNPPGGKHLVDTTLDALRRLGRDLQAIRRQVDQQQKGNHNTEEWIQVAGVIDRFLFWFYAVFIIVSFVVMICIWATSFSK